MGTQFRIPKQTDRALLLALLSIRDGMNDLRPMKVAVALPDGGPVLELPDHEPEKAASIAFVLDEDSEILPGLRLKDRLTNQHTITIDRQSDAITDRVSVASDHNWVNQLSQDQRPRISVKLLSLARKHLRAADIEASVSSTGADTEWRRYRDSQLAILNSVQNTQESILAEFTQNSLQAEADAKARYETLEADLKTRHDVLQEKLTQEHDAHLKAPTAREVSLKQREESFNTKEARYVARQGQEKQIAQIGKWLEGWSLTEGTHGKRVPVVSAYILAILLTGGFAVAFTAQTLDILTLHLEWWQWGSFALKSFFALAACVTFIIYFIRWASAWARQHAEEEFRNRARVLDIGRSAWLLEAVRDAQDNNRELPHELLKELSRNLFVYNQFSEASDLHPHAITDFVMQGLNSLRVKTPDGTEVEASRRAKRGA